MSASFACNDAVQRVISPSPPSQEVSASEISVTDLGTLGAAYNGGDASVAYDINNKGEIVGRSMAPSITRTHSVYWSDATGIVDIGGFFPEANSEARAINDNGDATGISNIAGGNSRAFLWSLATGLKNLGTIAGDGSSQAFAINNHGDVVGYSDYGSPVAGFLWTRSDATMHPLLADWFGVARGINNLQHIVGYAWIPPTGAAVPVLTVAGQSSRLANGPETGAAVAINDRDQVVGISSDAIQNFAFLWDAVNGYKRVPLPGPANESLAINSCGTIAGSYLNPGVGSQAFVWSERTGLINLPPLPGGSYAYAAGLNDRGNIVGGSQTANFTEHAVKWTIPGLTCNHPPDLSLPSQVATIEGSLTTFAASASDEDGDTLIFDWDFGDGSSELGSYSSTINHTYVNDGSFAVSVKARDASGASTTAQTIIVVNNSAPVITGLQLPSEPIALGAVANISATFVDAGVRDVHSSSVNWGPEVTRGGIAEPTVSMNGRVSSDFTYAQPGVYSVDVSVSDEKDQTSRSSSTSQPPYLVVYDPAAGFVTGGGWINSPQGALLADPSLTGRAGFGFVARYKSGASVPDGDTQFQFQTGNLDFRSISYDWLVVSGSKAKFKGNGSVNGVSGFGFLLSADDGTPRGRPDTFRIKIWNKSSGVVIYDNERGSSDDSDASTVLGGGSVVIHSK